MKQFKFFTGKDEDLKQEDCLSGLVSILSILHPDPKFAGQTKTKLTNNDVSSVVYQVASREYERFLLENPHDRKMIFNKVLRSYNLRIEIEKKIKEIKEKDKIFENSTLPGKLADCASKVKEERELFLVEGDSAGGSAKLGRNREFQAILPLKGKIINSEKTTQDKLFANEEISDLISSLGFTYKSIQKLNSEEDEDDDSEKFSISDILRYHKIIIMTDADVDGSHIAVLLLTFFYRFFPQLINNGHVFLAQPPLYKLKIGKKVSYFYSDEKLREAVKGLGDRFELQRYKGLGEMNPGQLWETTMNPEYRSLRLIQIDEVSSSDKIIETLMGKEVEDRKKFIADNSILIDEKELDI
nr:DNA gyrase subunit B-like [Lytechinus pictus]